MCLLFLPLQDEMEGLDLEGKTVEEKLYRAVTFINQASFQFNHISLKGHEAEIILLKYLSC